MLIDIPSVARSLKLSPSFKISDEINVRLTHLCSSCYFTSPSLCSWYYQFYHLYLVVTCCTTSYKIKNLCNFMDLRTKSEYFTISLKWFVFLTKTECVYCSVRNKYYTVIQVRIRVGSVNVVWWVGLVGSCKGTKTPLDSANQLFKWLHGAESFLGREYTPFTSTKLITSIVKAPVLLQCSQYPTTAPCSKSDESSQCTYCSCHMRYNIIVQLRFFQMYCFLQVTHHQCLGINSHICHKPSVFHSLWFALRFFTSI